MTGGQPVEFLVHYGEDYLTVFGVECPVNYTIHVDIHVDRVFMPVSFQTAVTVDRHG